MNNIKKVSTLAAMLKNSNIAEVSALAEGFLALETSYNELLHAHTKQTADVVMKKHERLLKQLQALDTPIRFEENGYDEDGYEE